MDKVTTTRIETVATFTQEQIVALLLREAGMPSDSVTQFHDDERGALVATITYATKTDDRPQAAPTTPAPSYNDNPQPTVQEPFGSKGAVNIGGVAYQYPMTLPDGWYWRQKNEYQDYYEAVHSVGGWR